MKKILLILFCSALITNIQAQNKKTYAVTSKGASDYFWNNIKEVDANTGSIIRNVFETDNSVYSCYDAKTKKQINTSQKPEKNNYEKPLAYGVAALALDSKQNRLYFSPMHVAQIRYIDLNAEEPNFYYVGNKLIEPKTNSFLPEEDQITRMVLVGKVGYAISNNANHIFQFSTGKSADVADLGALTDAATNGAVSIRNKCTGWGGDLVATKEGNLMLISAQKNIFKIDVASKIATHIGSISGIPSNVTTNGAVVTEDGKVLLTSSAHGAGFYLLDMNTLKATQLAKSNSDISISDLANANLLEGEKPAAATTSNTNNVVEKLIVKNENITIYPNPVLNGQFKISLEEIAVGNYQLNIIDLSGLTVFSKRIIVQNGSQVENVTLPRKLSSGLYMLKITDVSKKDIYVGKLVIQ